MSKLIKLFLFSTLLALASSVSTESAKETSLGKLTYPAVQGKRCVINDTMEMRKNHMNYITHQRAETTRLGKRWNKKTHKNNFSIEKCINCHARDEKGKPVKLKLGSGKLNAEHFCQSCHNYTAVTIDCFSCHSATPTGKVKIISKSKKKSK